MAAGELLGTAPPSFSHGFIQAFGGVTGHALLLLEGGRAGREVTGLIGSLRPPHNLEATLRRSAPAAVRAAEPEPGERHVAHARVDHLLHVGLGLMAAGFAPDQHADVARGERRPGRR